ncbi:TBC1 domain family member 31-like [Halyomorpha halys]|uniref:TBC1 domain family member 31-like n=1 Tax=Halyomorpha halys TaxID=286706 RepID=UPI0006D4EDBA|nr:TBC1 domain family member 31-like [Halyomorpha halys]XP_024216269.1 TBC1 domain family member 31-like [Halyomorpha halys]
MVACGDCNKLLYLDTSSWSSQNVYVLPHNYAKLKYIEFISHPNDMGESSIVAFLTNHSDVVLFDLRRGTILTVSTVNHDYCASLGISISSKYIVCLMNTGSISIFYNELWNDQDLICSNQNILKEPYDKVHNSYTKYLKMRNKDILNIITNLGQFPSDLRPFLWRRILSLPLNTTAYRDICRKGLHRAFSNILENPVLPIDLRFPVSRLVSNLVFWCPLLQYINCLPLMILRFSKLFKSSPMVAFEVVATILVNYCQKWFSEFPLVSQDITNYIEYVVKRFDLDLWNHFNKIGIHNIVYTCPIMQTLFAEVLVENDWLALWDNVLISETDFLTLAVAAFYIVNKNLFLSCKSKEEFEICIHSPVSTDISTLIKKTREMARILKLKCNFHGFAPLIKGNSYQILTDSMKMNGELTVETISNSENVSITRKIMEIHDTSEEEWPNSTNVSYRMNDCTNK